MPRPIRIEYAGASYHVINRGNRRNQVFFSDSDYLLFIEKLDKYATLYDVIIYSYCLMPNHYHLFLKTGFANLGKFMQSFNTSFTLVMNSKYNKSGHLFQGRYKARLTETELYKNELSRYIHLNPVKIMSLKNTPLMELKKHLRYYKWSSYPVYLGVAKRPKWLDPSFVLSSWGKNREEKIENYRKYVDKGLLLNNYEELSADDLCSIIGSESFRDKITRKYLIRDTNSIDEREQPALARLNTLSVDDIILAVGKYFSLKNPDQIVVRKGADRNARKIAMYLSVKYCKRISSLSKIASYFGVGINGVSSNTVKCEEKSLNDKLFKKQIKEMKNLLDDLPLFKNTKAKV
jgi:putative transposase